MPHVWCVRCDKSRSGIADRVQDYVVMTGFSSEGYTMAQTSPRTTQVSIAPTDALNLIVAHYPQALPVLQRFGLDTCCGGALSLRIAAEHHGLDLDQVMRALRDAIGAPRR